MEHFMLPVHKGTQNRLACQLTERGLTAHGAQLCCAAERTESARKSEWKETEVRCGVDGTAAQTDCLSGLLGRNWVSPRGREKVHTCGLNVNRPAYARCVWTLTLQLGTLLGKAEPLGGGTFRRRSLAGGIASLQQCGYWVVYVARLYFLFFLGFVTPEVCDQLLHVLQPFWSLRQSIYVTVTLPSYFVSGIAHDNKKSNNRANA